MMAHPPLPAHDGPSPDPLRTPLDAAQVMTARGWVVFPCDHPDAGLRCTGAHRPGYVCDDPRKRGKHPRVKWGEITTPTDSATLRAWFGDDARPANVAVACGPSGLLVVDEDRDGALSAYAASIGEVVPETFRVRTSRGWHWYFEVPIGPDGQRVPVGNAPGALAGWGMDVRGGASVSAPHGGYVIGPGSVHWSGVTYTADEPYAPVALAPGWLVRAVLAGPSDPREGVEGRTGQPGNAGTTTGTRYDDDPRYGSPLDLHAQFQRHCDEVAHDGGRFRWELFLAARDGWRLVALDLIDEDTMQGELAACVRRVWDADPDDRDTVIVMEEAAQAAERSPWVISGGPTDDRPLPSGSTFTTPGRARLTSDDAPVDRTTAGNRAVAEDHAESRPSAEELRAHTDRTDLEKEIRRQRLQRDAREALAAEGRRKLAPVDLDEWLDAPPAEYLVPGMLRRDGLAVLFGAPGAAKSFLVLDIALSFVTGKPWVVGGDVLITRSDGTRGMVHYVMAEGRNENNSRTNAWLHHHNAKRADMHGQFVVFDEAIPLVLGGAELVDYLEYVVRDKPDLIILDTKNLMYVGKESQGDDYGAMLRVLHMIRRAAGGCSIVLIDHSGLADDTRARGSNAQQGGVDTEIMVTEREGLRMVTMTRDKGAPLGVHEWHFRLFPVDGIVPSGRVKPVVPVPADPDQRPFTVDDGWWDDLTDLPDEVASIPGRGRSEAVQVFRVLRWVGGDMGLTRGELSRTLTRYRKINKPKSPAVDAGQLGRALRILTERNIIEKVIGAERFVLAAPYATDGLGTVLG